MENTENTRTETASDLSELTGYPKIKFMTIDEMEKSGEYSKNLIEYLRQADIEKVQYGARLRDGILSDNK